MNKTPMTLPIHQYIPECFPIALGCMGLGGEWSSSPVTHEQVMHAHRAIDAALDAGINFFDHADIYTYGKAEIVFGKLLKERKELRNRIYLQSKCGIRFADGHNPGRYDFSKTWITQSVEGILSRLNTEQLDVLLLHRPDPLMQVGEVAEAFTLLKNSGKVRYFGVSNMSHHQIHFLQSNLDIPLIANQLEMSLQKLDWLEQAVTVNHTTPIEQHAFPHGTLEYCQQHHLQLQAWGSLCGGLFSGKPLEPSLTQHQATAQCVTDFAKKYQVSREAIVLAFLRRHPAGIMPIIGTSDPSRIARCTESLTIQLTREDWYQLYVTARGRNLP